MKKVLLYTILLIVGLILSQFLDALPASENVRWTVRVLTMIALSFIMVHVGYEFDLDKKNLRQYGVDYGVAFTAASFPWIFVSMYFVFVLLPSETWGTLQAWKESLLAGRFAAPTSAGVLFSMLAAAGLAATWMFKKARILAIFDDLDTVLLMIPLKMLMVGVAWQLGIIVVVMVVLLALAYIFLHRWRIPITWKWVMLYSVVIVVVSEIIYAGSKWVDPKVPIHLEVLLPAFVLGCMVARPAGHDNEEEAHHVLETPEEMRAGAIISGTFMLLVGLNMPSILAATTTSATTLSAAQPAMGWGTIIFHVLVITVLSNLGKMFPAFCYRREAHWKNRLAVAIAMWPRGEVGAGVLVVSLGYGIGGPMVTIALLSLALNLAITGLLIMIVKKLIISAPPPKGEAPDAVHSREAVMKSKTA